MIIVNACFPLHPKVHNEKKILKTPRTANFQMTSSFHDVSMHKIF